MENERLKCTCLRVRMIEPMISNSYLVTTLTFGSLREK